MHLKQFTVDGEDFVGLMGMSSDAYSIVSPRFPDIDVLGVPVLRTKLYGTNLVGLFCAGNSNGLLLPYFVYESKITLIKEFFKENDVDVNIGTLEGKYTALGNLVACNDKAALVSPLIKSVKVVEDILGVEVVREGVGGHDEVGACCVVTNKGFVCHPDAESELDNLRKLFKVSGDVGSVNFGFPFVKSGLIANSNGFLVGSKTTGIELGRIDDSLGFLD